jgi:glycosyltransferase involved in cell wall biosynthesis
MTEDRPVVLHVLEALEGGTARHLGDIATHATGSRHHVVIPVRRVGGLTDETALPRLEAAGAEVHLVTMHRAPWSPANAGALRHVRHLVRSIRPDVVHGHSSIGGLLARLATSPSARPTVYTANGVTGVRVGVLVERALRRRTTAFVATSASEADHAARLGLTRGVRVAVIPNGIELEAPPSPLDLRTTLGIPAGAPLVGSISRLVPQKAPGDLVAACRVVLERVPDAHAVVIGDGELVAEYEAAVDAAGLRGRLHRVPSLDRAGGVLDQLDVFLLASRFEGGPYAPLEAMRAGTAVVLTDVVGSRDAVVDGASGRLVTAGRPDLLGAAVVALLQDPDERRRLGAGGRSRVVAHFDVHAMGTALDELYRSLLDGSGRPYG